MSKLTAKQIKWIDEINADKRAAERTLKIALNYHQNMTNELCKAEHAFWEDILESNGLDKSSKYELSNVAGSVSVVEIVEE